MEITILAVNSKKIHGILQFLFCRICVVIGTSVAFIIIAHYRKRILSIITSDDLLNLDTNIRFLAWSTEWLHDHIVLVVSGLSLI